MSDQESLSLSKNKPVEEEKAFDAEDFGKDAVGHLERMTKTGWIEIDEQSFRGTSPKEGKRKGTKPTITPIHHKEQKDKPANK